MTPKKKKHLLDRLDYCLKARAVAIAISVASAMLAVISLVGLEMEDAGSPTWALVWLGLSLVARLYEVAKDSEIATLEDKLTRI